ncbi:31ec964e-28cd-4564-90bf-c764b8c3d11e [Sclerotinia trifoliorum]|uniref:31ec964e-28cd-4564-90bf-c764b8c3d11e n=1 Tax=Sclerotinia trifoliorum TaxID=28548 RepID=A0A8H2VS80_9HELO|nr:31ec964e-28cd-4564-90bf-c764b8c3d11e [Sclerotinia trifoliorum]
MAAFGWSVGDLVSAISVVAKVSKALKDAGGAVDDYHETILFLESLKITLTTLHGLYEANVDPNVLSGLQSQLELVQKPIDTFTKKIKRELGSALDGTKKDKGVRTKLKRTAGQLEWAFSLHEQSQELNRKILVPLSGIQIQLGIHIHSVLLTVTNDISAKVEQRINDALPVLLQRSLASITALEYRRHADQRDTNRAIYRKIESLSQILTDSVKQSLNKSQQKDKLQSQTLEDLSSLIVKAIDRIDERLQDSVHNPAKMSASTYPFSHEPQICSSPFIPSETICRARPKSSEIHVNDGSSLELAESLHKGMIQKNTGISIANVVGSNYVKQQSIDQSLVAPKQAWVEATMHFRQFVSLLVQAFREYFIGLWPMFACLLYQAKLMQRCISQLPSLLSKENITFVDALGRSRRIPYVTYGHWETFNNFVLADFRKIPGESHVQKSRYQLIASDGFTTLDQFNWKRFVVPNADISMVVHLSLSVSDPKCPKCKSTSNINVHRGIRQGLTICDNPNCQLTYRLVPYNDGQSPQTRLSSKHLDTSSEVHAWLEVANSLKRVEYANMREKVNAIALTDASNNPQFQSNGPEPYRHLLGVKRIKDQQSYIGDEIRAHTGALKERKQETTEFELYFKSVQCSIFPQKCELCGFSDFKYPSEVPEHMLQAHTCIYTCLFDFAGCKYAFARKDQWECHVKSEHLNWLCDIDQCPNERLHPVNHYKKNWYAKSKPRHALALKKRADSANAILRASLGKKKSLASKLNCPIKECGRAFGGDTCWDDRMEHIGEHIIDNTIAVAGYLCSQPFLDNTIDELFVEWALSEHIVEKVRRNFRLVTPE